MKARNYYHVLLVLQWSAVIALILVSSEGHWQDAIVVGLGLIAVLIEKGNVLHEKKYEADQDFWTS